MVLLILRKHNLVAWFPMINDILMTIFTWSLLWTVRNVPFCKSWWVLYPAFNTATVAFLPVDKKSMETISIAIQNITGEQDTAVKSHKDQVNKNCRTTCVSKRACFENVFYFFYSHIHNVAGKKGERERVREWARWLKSKKTAWWFQSYLKNSSSSPIFGVWTCLFNKTKCLQATHLYRKHIRSPPGKLPSFNLSPKSSSRGLGSHPTPSLSRRFWKTGSLSAHQAVDQWQWPACPAGGDFSNGSMDGSREIPGGLKSHRLGCGAKIPVVF